MNLTSFVRKFRVDKPETFRLAKYDPGDTGGLDVGKKDATKMLAEGIERLSDLQERLYAQDCWAVLLIFQAMDSAGKDSTIKHVMSGINPQGCDVRSFKTPSAEELDHDFLWRAQQHLPERGRIGIFNRSYYEEVLVTRVHEDLLKNEKIPPGLVDKDIWKHRYKDIRAFERYLARNGTLILKFHLRLSKKEQQRRFLERIETPSKNWKFSMADIAERKLWDRYMTAYEDMIRNTSRPEAPWFVVPADNKWFTRLVVAGSIVEALDRLNLRFPVTSRATRRRLDQIKTILKSDDE
ncbi:MAG: polyphosphate kinase 2 family protein [Pseudolabrys sp.]